MIEWDLNIEMAHSKLSPCSFTNNSERLWNINKLQFNHKHDSETNRAMAQQRKRVANQLEYRQWWPLARAGGEIRRFSRPAVHRRASEFAARRHWRSSRDGSSREQPSSLSSWSRLNSSERGRDFPISEKVRWDVIKAFRRTGNGRGAQTHLNRRCSDENGCATTSSQARSRRNRRTRPNEEGVGVGAGGSGSGSDSVKGEERWIWERSHKGVCLCFQLQRVSAHAIQSLA